MSKFCFVFVLSFIWIAPGALLAQVTDPFSEANKAQPPSKSQKSDKTDKDDPFVKPSKAKPVEKIPEQDRGRVPSVDGNLDGFYLPKPGSRSDSIPKVSPTKIDDRIDLFVTVKPTKVRRGETFKITVHGVLRPGFHTDPMTRRADSDDQPAGLISRFRFPATPGFKPIPPIQETGEAEFFIQEGLQPILVYNKEFTWSQDILVLPDATPGPHKFPFSIKMQVCDHNTCVPAEPAYEPTIEVSNEPAIALTPEISNRSNETQPPPTVVPLPGAPPRAPEKASATPLAPTRPQASGKTLMGLILLSMGAALAMLCTPCVFPMIPITVSICLKQSQKEHHNALLTAAVYSLTIVVMLSLSMLLLGGLVVALANNVWMNLALGAVMVYFALSLFGMYDIELPRGLAQFTNAREDRGGYAGVVFMALTFTITSFTCTGPFLGPFLVAANETKMSFGDQLISAFVYSATFAAPFFVLALFPNLTKKLPKSGGWLNSVKVVMGFIELALAFKFLSNSDLAFNPGRPIFFNYESVLCAWIALSLACGLYLLGIFRLPHDSPVEHLSVPRMLLAGMFLSFAIYITPALWRVTPQGIVGAGVVAFLPLDTRIQPGEKEWLSDYETAYKQAADSGKLIFIDFTGVNCPNCRYNEKNVFVNPEVQKELKQYVRVQLYTDSVPDPRLSASEAETQGAKNFSLREHTFDDTANPFYAIIRPSKQSGPFVEKNGVLLLAGADKNEVRKGLINESQISDFVNFLRKPLQAAQNSSGAKLNELMAGK